MKHITIGEINKFQCVGSQCLYTCCAHWKITVDKKTDEYYQSVEGPFGEELRRKIDRAHNPAEIKLENGYCPFLNEEKLCRVYIELGPEHMCDICKKYPRREVLAGDIIFHYLTISCPEVGRIFLSRKAPMKIRVIEDESPFIPLSVRCQQLKKKAQTIAPKTCSFHVILTDSRNWETGVKSLSC